MQSNGSPPPVFDADEGRTYFLAELLIHPDMRVEDHVEDHEPIELTQTEAQILKLLRVRPIVNRSSSQKAAVKQMSGEQTGTLPPGP